MNIQMFILNAEPNIVSVYFGFQVYTLNKPNHAGLCAHEKLTHFSRLMWKQHTQYNLQHSEGQTSKWSKRHFFVGGLIVALSDKVTMLPCSSLFSNIITSANSSCLYSLNDKSSANRDCLRWRGRSNFTTQQGGRGRDGVGREKFGVISYPYLFHTFEVERGHL